MNVERSNLQAMLFVCTVDAIVTLWACRTTVPMMAGKFGIYTRLAVFPASSAIGSVAFQCQHQRCVGEASCNNNQRDPQIQFHCAADPPPPVFSSSHSRCH